MQYTDYGFVSIPEKEYHLLMEILTLLESYLDEGKELPAALDTLLTIYKQI